MVSIEMQIAEFFKEGGEIEKIASDDTAAAKQKKQTREQVVAAIKRRGKAQREAKDAIKKLKKEREG